MRLTHSPCSRAGKGSRSSISLPGLQSDQPSPLRFGSAEPRSPVKNTPRGTCRCEVLSRVGRCCRSRPPPPAHHELRSLLTALFDTGSALQFLRKSAPLPPPLLPPRPLLRPLATLPCSVLT